MTSQYDNEDFFSAYAQMPRSREGLKAAGEWHQLQTLFPDLKGKSVLDLGYGYGWHCRYCAQKGASHILGIDTSEKMIGVARQRNADQAIEYKVCSIENYDFPKDQWDFVISNLALHYVENLEEVFRKVHQTLKTSGTFVFNIEHPVFTSGVNQEWIYDDKDQPQYWPVDNYFFSGARQTHFLGQTIVKQHHTLTQILMGLIENHFSLDAVIEAQPPADMLNIAGMKDEMRRPMMLLVKASKKS